MMSSRLLLFSIATFVAVAACDVEEVSLDPAELRQAATYRTSMVRVSNQYTSNLAPNPKIDLWISKDSKAAYDKIRPDRAGANVTMPRGTVIVRAVYGGAQVAKLTVMGKGDPGSHPALGDWWFAVTDPQGEPLEENGVRLSGNLPQCVTCHDERDQDDYLFGVPAASHL